MKKYDNYKDSGIEWLGEIPEHWESIKLKYIISIQSGKGITNEQFIENGEFDIYGGNGVLGKTDSYTNDGLDLIIGRVGALCGNIRLVYGKKWISDNALSANTTQNHYFIEKCLKVLDLNRLANKNAQPLITGTMVKDQYIGLPSIQEQTTIANYLDHKTTQIDTLIAKKEQFISLLQEERTAVINQAVTKGLDPKVKMKDYGIEWLGEIPEHWEVKKLKFVSKITRGAILRPVDEPSYFDDNGEWTYLNISDATICDKYLDYGKLRLSELGSTKSARVEPNNLIITASATIGKPFINKIPVCVHDGFIPITELKVNIDFLYNYFKNPQLFNGLGKSNTQKNIYLEDVKNLIIPIPNLEEQLLIARYIEEEIIRIETLISKSLQEIELLKEYKTALISEVVTGKVDVRDVILN